MDGPTYYNGELMPENSKKRNRSPSPQNSSNKKTPISRTAGYRRVYNALKSNKLPTKADFEQLLTESGGILPPAIEDLLEEVKNNIRRQRAMQKKLQEVENLREQDDISLDDEVNSSEMPANTTEHTSKITAKTTEEDIAMEKTYIKIEEDSEEVLIDIDEQTPNMSLQTQLWVAGSLITTAANAMTHDIAALSHIIRCHLPDLVTAQDLISHIERRHYTTDLRRARQLFLGSEDDSRELLWELDTSSSQMMEEARNQFQEMAISVKQARTRSSPELVKSFQTGHLVSVSSHILQQLQHQHSTNARVFTEPPPLSKSTSVEDPHNRKPFTNLREPTAAPESQMVPSPNIDMVSPPVKALLISFRNEEEDHWKEQSTWIETEKGKAAKNGTDWLTGESIFLSYAERCMKFAK